MVRSTRRGTSSIAISPASSSLGIAAMIWHNLPREIPLPNTLLQSPALHRFASTLQRVALVQSEYRSPTHHVRDFDIASRSPAEAKSGSIRATPNWLEVKSDRFHLLSHQ
jgi:hypothetical protein